jgi:hypothetical protein
MSAFGSKADTAWIAAVLAVRGRGHFNDSDVVEIAAPTCGLILT